MITVHFPTGKMMTIPGANSFVTDDGLRIEFSANEAVSNSRQIKLTKEEKWNALCAWVPRVWKSCKRTSSMDPVRFTFEESMLTLTILGCFLRKPCVAAEAFQKARLGFWNNAILAGSPVSSFFLPVFCFLAKALSGSVFSSFPLVSPQLCLAATSAD